MAEKAIKSNDDIDWDNRVLCSDGNCIGVIGPNGRCKECGLSYEGDLPAAAPEKADSAETLPAEPPSSGQENTETGAGEEQAASASDADWENRRLCSDGNCIGVIGPDGKCKECGRPDEP
jgi:hypothetical protein